MMKMTYNPRDRGDISAATGFDLGDKFESEAQVRGYFTLQTVRDIFDVVDLAVKLDQPTLDAMADAVIEYRWHCEFPIEVDYARAEARVSATPALDAYRSTILDDDWTETDHLTWVATAPVAEIVDWASRIAAELATIESLSTEPQRLTTTIDQHRGTHAATGLDESAYTEIVTDWRDIGNGEPFTSDADTMLQACHKAAVAIAKLTPRGRELAGHYIADGAPSDLEDTIRLMEQAAWRFDGDDPDNPNPDDQF